uniref:Uncharacterized protein n=1 Tax=Janibacter limosus TaxID=53458 RepID=A0AC61U2W1_9MICO|nr:hypothetical protein [Janibacter limosus]
MRTLLTGASPLNDPVRDDSALRHDDGLGADRGSRHGEGLGADRGRAAW